MREFTALKKLAEGNGDKAGQKKVRKLFQELEDKMEMASDGIEGVRERLQSAVLADLLKQEQFPATESAACKKAVEAAFQAVNKAYHELEDLHMALGTHFEDPIDD
jgi:hypothetical protein